MFHELLSRDHEDGRATWQPQGVGSEAYLNGTSQEPTLEDARKDGHIIRARCAPLSPASGFPVSWSQQVIHEISGLDKSLKKGCGDIKSSCRAGGGSSYPSDDLGPYCRILAHGWAKGQNQAHGQTGLPTGERACSRVGTVRPVGPAPLIILDAVFWYNLFKSRK